MVYVFELLLICSNITFKVLNLILINSNIKLAAFNKLRH